MLRVEKEERELLKREKINLDKDFRSKLTYIEKLKHECEIKDGEINFMKKKQIETAGSMKEISDNLDKEKEKMAGVMSKILRKKDKILNLREIIKLNAAEVKKSRDDLIEMKQSLQ